MVFAGLVKALEDEEWYIELVITVLVGRGEEEDGASMEEEKMTVIFFVLTYRLSYHKQAACNSSNFKINNQYYMGY